MSVNVTNGFKVGCFTDPFFGEVNGIEVDNVYSNTVFHRAVSEINEKGINFYKSNDYDLSILKQCPTIKYIRISGEATLNDLIGLENICGIEIGRPIGENETFDFCRLPHVTMLSIDADGKNRTWMKMSHLKKLYVLDYLNKDLNALSTLKNLQSLSLSLGRITTLDGIEVFSALKHFEVDYCRKLKSINGLACLANLETLKICDCNGLENLEEFFCRLRTLKELSMFTIETAARQHLKSLSFIEAMESLQSFVSNYIINDNDLTPLLRLKNAEIFEEKSYYNLRDQDLPKWDK